MTSDFYHRIWDSWFDQSLLIAPRQCQVLLFILRRTKHFERREYFGGKDIWLKPGQFIFAQNEAARELLMHPKALYKAAKKLEGRGIISLMGYNTHTVGAVTKYMDRVGQDQRGVQQKGEGVQENTEEKYNGRHRESKESLQVQSTLTKSRRPPKSNGGSTHLDSKNLLLGSEDLKGEKENCVDTNKNRKFVPHPITGEPYDPETGEIQF